jgi:3-hydroxyisobutyrate dehydrogenase
MYGGAPDDYTKAEGIIFSYAKACRLMGPPGAGQLTKMVNQICIAGLVQALAEGLHFAKRAGLDPGAAVEIISKGAAQSWHMDTRHETMSAGKFGFGLRGELDAQGLALCLGKRAAMAQPFPSRP